MDSLDVERASGREVKRAAELEDVLGQLSLNENECVERFGHFVSSTDSIWFSGRYDITGDLVDFVSRSAL